eukprot:scaffold2905_cov76-Amphora_coffeaeformis.AAC.1
MRLYRGVRFCVRIGQGGTKSFSPIFRPRRPSSCGKFGHINTVAGQLPGCHGSTCHGHGRWNTVLIRSVGIR